MSEDKVKKVTKAVDIGAEVGGYNFEKYFEEKMLEATEKVSRRAEEVAGRIIADARSEAEKIIKEAKKSVLKGKVNDNAESYEEDDEAYLDERVLIKLFKDSGKYSQDVFVSVNGEGCLIQRGKEVLVKRKFALALEQSEKQDEYAAEIKELYAREYEEKRRQQEA